MLNLLYFYISTFRSVCAVPNMTVFCSSYFVLSRYVAQVLSEWFWDSPSCPYYYWYHFCFYIPHTPYFYRKIFTFFNLPSFLFYHISVSRNCNILAYMFLLHYHGLWCMVYCWGWFCQFAVVDSTVWLPCVHWLVSIDFGACSYQCFLSNFTILGMLTWYILSLSFGFLFFSAPSVGNICTYLDWACTLRIEVIRDVTPCRLVITVRRFQQL
jgi:hypothetical protein